MRRTLWRRTSDDCLASRPRRVRGRDRLAGPPSFAQTSDQPPRTAQEQAHEDAGRDRKVEPVTQGQETMPPYEPTSEEVPVEAFAGRQRRGWYNRRRERDPLGETTSRPATLRA